MNHISIEGMDGVGKSTTCKLLAEKLGYIFVEKPLHYLLDDSDDEVKQYQKVAKRINFVQFSSQEEKLCNHAW